MPEEEVLIVVRYLLVDDRDGRVLAEFASAQQAIRLVGRHARQTDARPPVSVVRVEREESTLAEITSMVSVRPLAPPAARHKRAPKRTTARRSSPSPRLSLR